MASKLASPPPTSDEIRHIFRGLAQGNPESFFSHVADDVDWTVMGTHPLAGRYHSKREFRRQTFARIGQALADPATLTVRQILVDGDWAAVELWIDKTAKSGLRFHNEYCWIVRFCDDRIVEVRAYLDSALVQQLLDWGRV